MDEILVKLMQDNAYREQVKIKTYLTPTTNPVNQLITSPTEADTRLQKQHKGKQTISWQ